MGHVGDEGFWAEARRLVCTDPERINLNAGTLSPTPLPILQRVTELRRQMATNPSDFVWRQLPPLVERSRARLADYLRCEREDLLLVPNTTFAVNLICSSFHPCGGGEILTTDHEYRAMMFPLQRLAERCGMRVKVLELPNRTEDPAELVDAFERAMTDDTRAVFFSHVTPPTGLLLPARQVCELARRRGALSIVDGAHAPGMVPLDLSQVRADFYSGNCHKWMMAPAGAAFLHVARHRRSMLAPLISSWGAEYDAAKADENSGWGGTFWQREMEFHGTTDRCPQMVLGECLDFRESLGGDTAVLKRTWQLSDYARERLAACGLTCATPRHESLRGGALTAFEFPCDDPIAIRDRLWNGFQIECPVTHAAGRTFLRVSTGWFNTTQEIERLGAAVQAIRPRS